MFYSAPVPREYDVELPTHQVRVLEWGSSTAPLVVALHGFPDTAWTWRRVAPRLADAGLRVAAPFMRGYAPSGIPRDGDYSIRALMTDAVALHRLLGGDERTALLGHDWGAIAAAGLAGAPASPYRAVACLAAPPVPLMNPTRDTWRPWLRAMTRQPFRSWYIGYNQVPGLAERSFDRLAARLWRSWSPGYVATEDLAFLRAAVPDSAHARAVVSYYRALWRRGTRAAWAEPRLPLLYLHGDRDGALDRRFFDVVAPRLSGESRARLVTDTGHFLHLERPGDVAEAVIAFLQPAPD